MDGRPVPADGVTLEHDGPMEMCVSGLHASRRIIDALQYAPIGKTICRVRCTGEIVDDSDKLICRSRTIIWRVDGSNILRKFACQQALSVAHLWNMPQIVREYLETQDESKQAAAWAAAGAAAWAATRAATRAATQAAAWAAAWAATRAATWAAARAAAWAAAGATTGAASAGDAAWDAANTMLTKMVMEKHKKNE